MWQRIQSLYLFVVAVLSVFVFFSPLAELSKNGQTFVMNFKGITSLTAQSDVLLSTWLLYVLIAITAIIAVVSFFMFKKRMLQIRLCIFNIVLLFGYYAMLFIYLYVAVKMNGMQYHIFITSIFPLINAILLYLAIRAIGKDEAMVRSLNRMRK